MKRLWIVASAMVLMTACGGSQPSINDQAGDQRAIDPASAPASPPQAAPSSCEVDFENAAGKDDMHDSVSDLDPALADCTIPGWVAAAKLYPDALNGTAPLEFLGNDCQDSSAALCLRVAARDRRMVAAGRCGAVIGVAAQFRCYKK